MVHFHQLLLVWPSVNSRATVATVTITSFIDFIAMVASRYGCNYSTNNIDLSDAMIACIGYKYIARGIH